MKPTRTMSWQEIDADWNGLTKRHKMEVAEAVVSYCIGHKMDEVATRLGQSRQWLQSKLDMAGVGAAIGEGSGPRPLIGKSRGIQEDCMRVAAEFAPAVVIKFAGQGGKQTIDAIGRAGIET